MVWTPEVVERAAARIRTLAVDEFKRRGSVGVTAYVFTQVDARTNAPSERTLVLTPDGGAFKERFLLQAKLLALKTRALASIVVAEARAKDSSGHRLVLCIVDQASKGTSAWVAHVNPDSLAMGEWHEMPSASRIGLAWKILPES
jgi:N-acetylglutamate synthase-like GNAT family acetyltransferase